MKSKSLVKLTVKEPVRVERLTRFASLPKGVKAALARPKDFKAAVVVDKDGSPRYFVFDTYSLWDFLCAVDEAFEERTSANEYVLHNPVGWLVDAIEAHLPLHPTLVRRLKKGVEEATKLGVVPLERIEEELGLS